MTHEERLEKKEGLLERFISASSTRFEQVEESIAKLQQVQLGTTAQLGMVIQVMREGFQQQGQQIQHLTESIERLEMLVENMLRQRPAEGS